MEKICVAVRVRPPVNDEASSGSFWKVEDNQISLHRTLDTPVPGVSFTFDHVFDQDSSNSLVYELLTKDVIHAAIEGFNGTAFAYGQTSSGKTFTMNGSENDPGIVNLAVKDIFKSIETITDREFLIRVSYMEIYNEDINDLFGVENQKLPIHESLERGVFVAGLKEEIVNSADQVLKLIQLGEVNRHFGETNMNARSSRSHTIFRMVIESKGKDTNAGNSDDAVRVSVLNLVDLAGSERIAKTGAGGVRLKEGKHINKSLMVLGNVINKLSEGAKRRGHIPYRDSKLTRILQPALGGNAKTSIICTLAPEELHIEETKGTLQFASRAKRITNCVQVNEILTDAALLKRQKLEIEELRKKLQGSHAEVLEQEVFKLRNDMLKYELEREKLAMELEEERKSHREKDQVITDQQVISGGLNSFSDSDKNSGTGPESTIESLVEESNEFHNIAHIDEYKTPCLKPGPNVFVAKRSQYSSQVEFSPLPDAFSDTADEDTWFKMNKGFIADLDSLHMTPARKVQSFPPCEESPDLLIENYKHEVQNLQNQLKFAIDEKDKLERQQIEQTQMNNRLMEELTELQQEAQLMREIPQRLSESVENCKEIYNDVLSIFQSFVSDDKHLIGKVVSCTSEIGKCLFSTLETHFSMATDDKINRVQIQEQCNVLREKLINTINSLELTDSTNEFSNLKGNQSLVAEIASWREKLIDEVDLIKENYENLEKVLVRKENLLQISEERYHNLEKELKILVEEKNNLTISVSSLSQRLALVIEEKEKVMLDLKNEIQKRKVIEDELKQFSVAFARRQNSLASLHSDFKSRIDELKEYKPVSIAKSLGY